MLASLLFSLGLLASASTTAPVAAPAAASTTTTTIALTPQFRRYGTANGLPSSAVYIATQDHDGAMWFGTKGGLARFDGLNFTVFRHRAGDSDSLANNGISALLVDQQNRVWAGGLEAGLNRYDRIHGRFEHWSHNANDADSLNSDKVWTISQTRDSTIWIGTARGLERMRPDGSGFDHVVNPLLGPKPEDFGTVAALYQDGQGRLWIGSSRGVFRRDADGSLHAIRAAGSDQPIDAWRIEGDGNEVRLSASYGLYIVDAHDIAQPVAPEMFGKINVLSTIRDRAGRLWIGTQRGLFLRASPDGPITQVVDQPLLPGNLPGTWVFNMTTDREGGLWVSLFDGGVAYLAPGWSRVSRFSHIPEDPRSLGDSEATAVALGRDGNVWVGGRTTTVDKLNPFTGEATHVLSHQRGDVVGLTEDAQHRLWIVTQGAIYRYSDGKMDEVKGDAHGLRHPLEVEAGPDGMLYARSFGEGLFRINQETLDVSQVPLKPANDDKVRWGSQLTLHDGVFWYASDGGLLRLNPTHEYFERVPGVASDRGVDAFAFATDGMWLARPDGLEFYGFTADGLALRQKLGADEGWPSIGVFDLAIDASRRVWIFGRDGLWRYDSADHGFRRIGLQDGLINGEFSRGYARMPYGYIFAPTLGGVIGFNPDAPDIHAEPPPLAVTDVHVQRHGESVKLVPHSGMIDVGWQDRGLTVTARVFSFIDPSANHYRFRLGDFDSGWVDTGDVGVREFAGLDAGDYTLEVMGAGADGRWVPLAQPLSVHVESPPWVRWWAWCGYMGLAMLLVWLLLRIWQRRLAGRHRIQLAEQRRQLAEHASAAKTQFLATLSHEIRTPMTGVIGMAELLMGTPLTPSQREYTDAMQRSGSLLLKLVNDALDLARIEAGRLELDMQPFDPRALIDDVARLEYSQARKKGLRFEVGCDDDLPRMLQGDPMRIKQVLLNLANNAMKFTVRGQVTLRAGAYSDGVLFSVADTGPGISEAGQSRLFQRFEQEDSAQRHSGSGLGLAICRELVGLMGGSIELESRVGHGSTFRVRLPLRTVDVPAQAPAVVDETLASLRPLRILLIEDDTIVAAVIRGLLEQQGHDVCYVGNGLAAMAELVQGGCDVILLDLDLPGIDGFQVARLIRQREALVHIPIIVVTARSGNDDETLAREAGLDGFLRKPLSGRQLAEALRGVRVDVSAETEPEGV